MGHSNAFIPGDQVILQAAGIALDPGGRIVGMPVYRTEVRNALRGLCYDIAFDSQTWDGVIPDDLKICLPFIYTGIRGIYLYSGDDCNISCSTPLIEKPNFTHKGKGGYFAQNKWYSFDPSFGQHEWFQEPSDMYYGNTESGILYLSWQCTAFTKIHIAYTGTGQDDETQVPAVPMWAQDAVKYYVARSAAQRRVGENYNLYSGIEAKCAEELNNPMKSWTTAKVRYKQLDQQQRMSVAILTNGFVSPLYR